MLERAAQAVRGLAARKDAAHEPIQGGVVPRAERMGDDHVGDDLRERVRVLPAVLVHVHDRVGRFERPDAIEARGLGAAHARDVRDAVAWMDAERCTSDHPIPDPEIEEKLGDARYEGDDSRAPGRGRVHRPRRVAQRRIRHQSLPV